MTSMLPSALGFQMQPVECIREVVGIFHRKIGLPDAINYGRLVRHRVPNSPTVHQFSHLIPHSEIMRVLQQAFNTHPTDNASASPSEEVKG